MIAMGMNDGMGWGDSPEERAMDDPDEYKRGVYSTRYFRFCNIIAEKFCKRYPDVQIFVYAYMTAVEPPKLKKLHKNLFIGLCTYRRDYKHRINDPSSSVNARSNAETAQNAKINPSAKTAQYRNRISTLWVPPLKIP